MALLDLPNEILSRIFRFFINDDQKDIQCLKQIRLCSHRLDALTQPIFYSTFEESKLNSLDKLLINIARDDRFSRYLDTFQAGNRLWRARNPHSERLLAHTDEKFSAIVDSYVGDNLRSTYFDAARFGATHPSDLLEALKEGNRNGLATLALLSLPCVRHLKLGLVGLREQEIELLEANPGIRYQPQTFNWLVWLLRRAAVLQESGSTSKVAGSLYRLRRVDIRTLDTNKIALSQVLPFMMISSLRRFSWSNVDIYWDMPTHVRLSNIRYLHLQNITLSDESLGRLMALFTAIEELELESGLFIKMATHIEHLRPTLRHLSLTNSYGPQAYVQRPSQRSSYQGFNRLETMSVATPHIDGWISDLVSPQHAIYQQSELTPLEVVIPTSVQDLRFTSCTQRFLEKLGGLLTSDWLDQSQLRQLDLNCHWKYKTWIDGAQGTWVGRCKAAGVELLINYKIPSI